MSEPAPLHAVCLIFPELTQLDLTGPLQVLTRVPGLRVALVAETLTPVATDCGFTLAPTHTFADAPSADLLLVPGGFGIEPACQSEATVSFVRAQGAHARWVTSVCTGALLLGVAGLLRGKRATTHWAYHPLLAKLGATPEKARVVRDGNVITGGGVTAGIDFAFTLAAEIAGEEQARRIQLALEYDPQPPFDGGTPAREAPERVAALEDRYRARIAVFEKVIAETFR